MNFESIKYALYKQKDTQRQRLMANTIFGPLYNCVIASIKCKLLAFYNSIFFITHQ